MTSTVMAVLSVLLLAATALDAHIRRLDDRDVARALAIANGSDATRKAFHAAYLIPVKDPVVTGIEVITEYRRFVLAAEAERRAGNWMLARGGYDRKGRTLKDILAPHAGRVSIVARLRFHPQNAYFAVPPFEIILGEPALIPLDVERTPQLAPAIEAGQGQAILGGTITASFNALSLSNTPTTIGIQSDGREVVSVEIDLSRID